VSEARRILVTGASGFIGRHALAPLQRLCFEVHATARTIPQDAAIKEAGTTGIRWHAADLLDPAVARDLLEAVRPSHLLHFAWYAEHGKFWDSAKNLDWLAASLALVRDFAAAGGRRFVGAGTCAEYDWGQAAQENRFDEDKTPLRPSTLYGAAKASAFLTGSAFAKSTDIAFAWGRIFHLFGSGEDARRLVPLLIQAHLRGERLDCGPESLTRDYLPVKSVADAFAHLCASVVQGPVNIGSGRATTLGGLSESIETLAGSRGDIRFGGYAGAGPERLVPLIRRLTEEALWRPPESPDTGLKDAVAWWRFRLTPRPRKPQRP
jgi:nucleoside-diphosphate-sugar epimerase